MGHFRPEEFRCRCGKCPTPEIEPGFLVKLEELRRRLDDKPVFILSGHRCQEYNRKVGGATASQHMVLPVRCADIAVRDTPPAQVAEAAEDLFTGLGRYSGWTHVDTRPTKSRWTGQN